MFTGLSCPLWDVWYSGAATARSVGDVPGAHAVTATRRTMVVTVESKRAASLDWDAAACASGRVTKRAPRIRRSGSSPSRRASRGWSRVGTRLTHPDQFVRDSFLRRIVRDVNP